MTPADTPSPRWHIRPVGLINAAVCLAWIGTAVACLRPRSWPLELANHLHVLYLAALLPAALLCLARRRWGFAMAHAVFVVLNLWVVVPAWFGSEETPSGEPAIELALLNVNSSNTDYALTVELLRQEQPDVAVILEVNEPWQRALQDLVDLYPHQHVVPRPDNFGIAVLSRQPVDAKTHRFSPDGLPSVIAAAPLQGRLVQLVATHPLPPMRPRANRQRDQHLQAVGDYIAARTSPVVLLGDLNTSPWAPAFHDLIERSGLRDPRRGRGLLATWPSPLPVIPIDHVLVSPELSVTSLRVGPAIGSDHRPLFARVRRRR